jgi:hypothetical protein
MKPEIIRPHPHRISPGRVLVALIIIAWCGWYAIRVVTGLERAHKLAPIVRGPVCTTTVYYDQCPTGVWRYGESGLSGWCRP